MSMEELEIEAMMLPPDERERLADRLLWSLGSDLAYERERSSGLLADFDDEGRRDALPWDEGRPVS